MHVEKLKTDIEKMITNAGLDLASVEFSDGEHLQADFEVGLEVAFSPTVSSTKEPGRGGGQAMKLHATHAAAHSFLENNILAEIDGEAFKTKVSKSLEATAKDWLDPSKQTREVKTSHYAHTIDDCENCRSSGRVICGHCAGGGEVTCHGCNGHRQLSCRTCRQTGWEDCLSCGGVGNKGWDSQNTRYIPCIACANTGRACRCRSCGGHGWVDCNTCNAKGLVNCETCRTSGRVTCDPCSGHGAFVNTHQGNIKLAATIRYKGDIEADVMEALTSYSYISSDPGYKPKLTSHLHRERNVRALFSASLPVTKIVVADRAPTTKGEQKTYLVRAAGLNQSWVRVPKFIEDMLAPRANLIANLPDDKIPETVKSLRTYQLGREILESASNNVPMLVSGYKGTVSPEFAKGMVASIKGKLPRGIKKPTADFWRGYVFWLPLVGLVIALAWPIWVMPGRHISSALVSTIYPRLTDVILGSFVAAALLVVPTIPLMVKLYGQLSRRWMGKLTGTKVKDAAPIGYRGKRSFTYAFVLTGLVIAATAVVPELNTMSVTSITTAQLQ